MNSALRVKPLGYGLFIVFLFLVPRFVTGQYWLHVLISAGMGIVLASSLRLIAISGQLSLAHGGMVALGAYTEALLVTKSGLSSWIALLVGGLVAGVIAMVAGYPIVRLKGLYFVMVTFFLAQTISTTILEWRSLTGGSMGIINIPKPDAIVIPGLLNMDFGSKADSYYFILVLALVVLSILYSLEHSRVGLTWFSIAQADYLAASVGVNTAWFKVLSFFIGSFFAGLVGGFYSPYVSAISPEGFGFNYTVGLLLVMRVGGAARFPGPIVGATILTILPEVFRPLQEYQPFVFAAALILIIIFMPEGLIGLPDRFRKLAEERLGSARNKGVDQVLRRPGSG